MKKIKESNSSNKLEQRDAISLANKAFYDQGLEQDYIDGTPHLKHTVLRQLFIAKMEKVFEYAKNFTSVPKVLDLGAGEGSTALIFLEFGADVTAVDISEKQLEGLKQRCESHRDCLKVICQDVSEFLATTCEHYDIIVVSSFLHHIPDYLGLIRQSITVLNPHGQFFSFQDPIRYDLAGKLTMAFTNMAYFSWRIFRGDILGGIQRRIRRSRGVYLADSPFDNAEYHVARNGVDQEAIQHLLTESKFDCELILYFSSQSSFFQPIGSAFGIKNTFGVIARKK